MANKYAGTKTEKNLWEAFAGESQARNKYTYFASVARQVSSALVSLTSVFGMGTGGPSPLETPTISETHPEN